MGLIRILKERLKQQGLRINKPATFAEIQNFEAHYKIKLSETLKEYFLTFNGTGEANFGDEGYSFFSLDEFKLVNELKHLENFPHTNCFAFSEYLLWMTAYAVRLDGFGNDLGVYEICNTNQKVCNSFQEFILLFLDNNLDQIINNSF